MEDSTPKIASTLEEGEIVGISPALRATPPTPTPVSRKSNTKKTSTDKEDKLSNINQKGKGKEHTNFPAIFQSARSILARYTYSHTSRCHDQKREIEEFGDLRWRIFDENGNKREEPITTESMDWEVMRILMQDIERQWNAAGMVESDAELRQTQKREIEEFGDLRWRIFDEEGNRREEPIDVESMEWEVMRIVMADLHVQWNAAGTEMS